MGPINLEPETYGIGVPEVETRVIPGGEKGALERAVAVLRAGGLVAFPTDTVYGLAALPADRDAVVRIYEVKSRSSSNPIALLLSDLDRLAEVAVLLEAARPLARRFWPGGLSLVLPKTEAVPQEVTAGPTVAVRVPDLALARSLIEAAGGVLAVTSANRSGEPAALDAEEVLEQLAGQIELVVDGGRCRGGFPQQYWTAPSGHLPSSGTEPSARQPSRLCSTAPDLPDRQGLPSGSLPSGALG